MANARFRKNYFSTPFFRAAIVARDLRCKLGVDANAAFMIFSNSGWYGVHAMVHLEK